MVIEPLESGRSCEVPMASGRSPDVPPRVVAEDRPGAGGSTRRGPRVRAPHRSASRGSQRWRSTSQGSPPFLDRQVPLGVVVCRAERPEIAHVVERARVAVVGRPVVDDEALGRPAVLAAPAVATLDGQDRPLPLRGAVARIAGAAPRGSAARAEPGAAAEHMPPHDEQTRRLPIIGEERRYRGREIGEGRRTGRQGPSGNASLTGWPIGS